MTSLNEYADRINAISRAHGFWPSPAEDEKLVDQLLDATLPSNFTQADELRDAADELKDRLEESATRNMGEMLMLAVSELAEALEEHRSGKQIHYHSIKVKYGDQITPEADLALKKMRDNMEAAMLNPMEETVPIHEMTDADTYALVACGIAKPEGLAVELADCVIRCLDTLKSLDVDIDAIVEEKMLYNASRPHKHGKAY